MASRAQLIFGTDEPVAPLRRLRAGALTAVLDAGNLRYIRWGSLEVIRGVSFVVRDTNWGTYSPLIADLEIEETGGGFRVDYSANCDGADGDFSYRVSIEASTDGTLEFDASGGSSRGFTTNRTGFVVLHPLEGVVGRPLRVTHVSGEDSETTFPLLIDPGVPATDIRALYHRPTDGVGVNVRFEGEAFEMEDHRNWTDASFKTYVRPLSRGYPYRIAAGESVEQQVQLRVTGVPPAVPAPGSGSTVRIGPAVGVMPEVGLFAPHQSLSATDAVLQKLASIRPSFITARIDARVEDDDASAVARLSGAIAAPLGLEIIIPGKAPDAEVAVVARRVAAAGLKPRLVFVAPARDLKARKPNDVPQGEASAGEIVATARVAFPDSMIGGGVPIGFPEMNRNRPPAGVDFVTHATQATVHAADDLSVMETLETLPHLARTVHAIAGEAPYRLGLATIGAPADTYYGTPSSNPAGGRVAMAEDEPRQHGLFAAAFALGYAASAAAAGVGAITLGACGGPAGVVAKNGREYPLAVVIGWLASLAGKQRLTVEFSGAAKVAAIACGDTRPVLCVANLGSDPVTFSVSGLRFSEVTLMDAAALAAMPAMAIRSRSLSGVKITLDSYAVCRLA